MAERLPQEWNIIEAGLCNSFTVEDPESEYKMFRHVDFTNYWIYSFFMIALLVQKYVPCANSIRKIVHSGKTLLRKR